MEIPFNPHMNCNNLYPQMMPFQPQIDATVMEVNNQNSGVVGNPMVNWENDDIRVLVLPGLKNALPCSEWRKKGECSYSSSCKFRHVPSERG